MDQVRGHPKIIQQLYFWIHLLISLGVRCTNLVLHVLQAFLQALGDRKGINRFGDFSAPLDEALVHVALVGLTWSFHVN
jgi:imidazoleglycerol phosphate dehydratase HisB